MGMVIITLLFSLNILLTYLANEIINNTKIEGIDTKNNKLIVNATVSVFPWIKIGAFDVKYFHKNKLVLSIGEVYTKISFLDLMKKKFTLKKIKLDDMEINLNNFPQPALKLSDKPNRYKQIPKDSNPQQGEKNQLKDMINFINFRELQFSNIKIINNQHNLFTVKSLHFVKPPKDSPASIKATLLHNNQTININGTINTQKRNYLLLKIAQQSNEIFITIQKEPHQISGQIKGTFPNRRLLKMLQIVPVENLPNTFYFRFNIGGQKLNISSFKMTYADNTLSGSAIIDGLATPVITLNISLYKQWIESLNDSNLNTCFIPYYIRKVIQGLNTKINLTIIPQNESLEEVEKYTMDIDLSGIKHKGSLPSYFIQKQLDICFPANNKALAKERFYK